MDGPKLWRAASIWSAADLPRELDPNFADARTATAPATWGVACDVPFIVIPAATMQEPGATMSRMVAVCEKLVSWSGAEPASQFFSDVVLSDWRPPGGR